MTREKSSKEIFEEVLDSLDDSIDKLKDLRNHELQFMIEHIEHCVNELKKTPRDEPYWSDFG